MLLSYTQRRHLVQKGFYKEKDYLNAVILRQGPWETGPLVVTYGN